MQVLFIDITILIFKYSSLLNFTGFLTAGVAGPDIEVPLTGFDMEKENNFTVAIGCDDSAFTVILLYKY